MEKALQNRGYKLTKPRRLVIDVLNKADKPLSAREIFERLQKRIDLASVYRSLVLFKKLDLIGADGLGKKIGYYTGKHHHHIVCRQCGRVACLPCELRLKGGAGYGEIKHTIDLSGICPDCRNKQ